MLPLCINAKQAAWKRVAWKVTEQFEGFFLFFPPAVVFSTPIHYKEKIWARISGLFLCLQPVSSELVAIFSPAPGVSVLAQMLTVGITVFYNKLLFGHLDSTMIVLLDALPMINVPC